MFRQKLSTAIGTKFAPGFANIFMGALEKRFLGSCEIVPWMLLTNQKGLNSTHDFVQQ